MALVTRTATVDLDSWFYDAGTNYGNGKGSIMAVGLSAGSGLNGVHRFGIRIPRGTIFDGVPTADAITAFNVKLRARNTCVDIGGAVRLFLERATGSLAENSYAVTCGLNTDGAANSARYPGPTGQTPDDRGSYSGAPTDGQWIAVNCLALGKWWFAHPEVTALVLVAKAANNGLTDYEETSTARRLTVYTRHTSSAPYAEMTFSDNLPAYAPSDLYPPDGSKVATTSGTSMTVSGKHLDPEGNAAVQYQAQAFPAGTTDEQADLGSVAPIKNDTVTATTAHGASRSHTFTGLATRTNYEWRLRFNDGQGGGWGPYSLLQTAGTAFKPTATNLSVQPGTTTPLLYASISSGDPGDFITAVDEYIYQDPAAGEVITKWAPPGGHVEIGGAPSRSEVPYGGSALLYGTQYRRRVVVYNRDGIPSDLTANTYFTQSEAVGPDVTPGDVETKLNTLQPTVTLTDPGAANINQARVEWLNPEGTVVLWDTGVESFASAANRNMQAPAGIYDYGQRPRGRAYIRVTGNANMGPARDFQLHLNNRPGTALLSVSDASAVDDAARALLGLEETGVVVVPLAQPTVAALFRDFDLDLGYVEAPSRSEFEVRTLAEAHFGASPYVDAAAPIATTLLLPALAAETTYKVRERYDDNGAVRADWSDYLFVKRSALPTLTDVTPAAAATITDPTPSFEWTYGHTGGLPQAAWRLVARLGGTDLYDSEMVYNDDTETAIPAFLLPNEEDIEWTLTVWNTDGLAASVTRTFTTDFTQPPAPTGLIIAADNDEKALLAIWDISGVPTNEFEAYIVEARQEGGQFERVAYITDKTAAAFLYRGAGHNRETIIRVKQTNGWAESAAIEDSGSLLAEGYWVRTASRIDELVHVTGHGPGDTQTKIEGMEPPGRGEKLLLNWGSTGYEGTFSLFTNDREQLARLRGYKERGEAVMLKFPYGDVRYAKITSTPDTDGVAEWFGCSVSYIEITPESAGF